MQLYFDNMKNKSEDTFGAKVQQHTTQSRKKSRPRERPLGMLNGKEVATHREAWREETVEAAMGLKGQE